MLEALSIVRVEAVGNGFLSCSSVSSESGTGFRRIDAFDLRVSSLSRPSV